MWLAPWFLLGIAGVGLPLWLHRFARQTDEKHAFASLMFLEPSTVRRSRRHELRYWLLLLARLLLIILLALAFAGPLWRIAIKPGATGATLHVIAMDTSLSMRYTGVWERAQERAGEIIASARGNDRVMLVAADHRLRVLHEPVFASSAGAVRGALQSLKPGYSRLDYGALVSGSAAWGAGPGEQVRVHLVTDVQQSASPLRFADLQPPPGVQLELVDVGEAQTANLRVADVTQAPREPGTVLVRVEGDAAALKGRELLLEVNGQERARVKLKESVALPHVERFVIGELGNGEHRLRAVLQSADALPEDDAHHALVRRVQPRVLIVAANPAGDDAIYLRAALQSLASPRFEVETAQVAALATRALSDFSAVIVSDAGLLNAQTADALARHVRGGGAALLTLGTRSAQQSAVPVSGAELARGRARAAANEPARVGELEQSHAVLREPGAWRSIRFFRHVAVTAPDDAQVLLQLGSGAPLLFEQNLDEGRLLVFASPLDRQWNDLAIHPLFVRFIAEATAYLAGARADAATATVGAAMEASLARRGGGQVFDPTGKRAMLLDASGEGPRLVPEVPGYYEVRGGGRSDFIAVNADARESQLTPLPAASRERWLALKAVPAASPQGTPSGPAVDSPVERLTPVWFWFLLGAALLALLEPLLANRHLHVQRERSA